MRADTRTHTHTNPPDVCLSIVYAQNAQTRATRGPRQLALERPDRSAFTSACGEAAVPQVAFLYEAAVSFWKGRQKSHFARALSPLSANLQLAPWPALPDHFRRTYSYSFLSTGSDSGARLMALMLRDSISSVYSVVCTQQ